MRQLYISIPQRIQLNSDEVRIGDIAQVITGDKVFTEKVNQIVLLRFQEKTMEIRGITEVIELLSKKFGNLNIVNLGETEFIIEKVSNKRPNKIYEIIRVSVVCGIVYLGSAFSVMTFNEDGCVRDLLDMLYKSVMGKSHEKGSVLEIAYSLGITFGILIFYNHVFRKKKESDPTPIQVEMRHYEMDVNETIIINKDREGGS
ncbi:stage V sporulation protein AA [[Clostridium] polysaccharolyticum]|uniref:Stage V sporulation protein AA n=1 Tax=[Clostridium] polysaccharolyticum TaxID=29364 RepID=A0A1H9Y6S5_9FIRM|nr:stage V sporulation protein AA [[Clostridium] polysaccharolyticum]SES64582.1 stage V sporulation protein AA [[Clostridium] polysaccharolyticum]